MKPSHIHTAGDGRGYRNVYVNDRLVEMAEYADERRGIVRAYRQPLKIDKHGKRALTYTLHGNVRVEPKPGKST